MTEKEYKELFKIIKPYVNFNIDLRKKLSIGDKRLITKYTNQFKELYQGMNIKIFRSSNKANLKTVQNTYHQVFKTLPRWKVAFVPYSGSQAPSIRVKNGIVKTFNKRSKLKQFIIPIENQGEFLLNTREYVQGLLDKHNVPDRQKLWVKTGDYLSTESFEAELLADEMEDWVNRYENAETFITGFQSAFFR
ncbi:putative terminal protein [Vibrio phage 1.069.O._10N.286.49.F11]|uniref:Putative terminal protein n=7 Tax=Autolykiviridae TaxID=2184034 RepID=A0A2I7S833_9VIRU|nr:putative terminal protein [Vibrio phage 1.008.O._10N.286.54.E5]AUR81635.1 putative terminal protein [Vibrio phage 1.011.O._10N.286.49.B11]AUR83774.1 putative terminal protein [Vibrio phage 1.040.O._10N.286.45.B9]AUR84653.1 putative terminal protein [Vibrio phage 1.062.O._10N.286.55.C3]AUR85150.1 putative terminal protein [Vibrio phage 1.069.O._10N.286.49.F11]AUR89578.1 putative terminal protein [Vibrio phage 1.125.O._10N.286.49.F5]AUS02067.1 putative terminal protein [Vibrio phage 2.092.O.